MKAVQEIIQNKGARCGGGGVCVCVCHGMAKKNKTCR